eukprot:comp23016_c0_seq1/m.36731 comp23016_c0_seq1/g.36731  ORF comp23016_c0_seq1/g.36731 comp23016_c0_seq1/m.36731 type:complete len:241 (-) comp23016_c0_seq1:500-1222(-)
MQRQSAMPCRRLAKKKKTADDEKVYSTLLACQQAIDRDQPIRTLLEASAPAADATICRRLGLLTAKPMLYVANIDDSQAAALAAGSQVGQLEALRAHVDSHGAALCMVSASTEADLTAIDEAEEKKEMLELLGVDEDSRGVAAVGRAIYSLLGLQSFYTAGEKEIRAWPVRRGATAPEAAGVIHSDLQRGFVRAEVCSVQDLVDCTTMQAVRAQGKLRTEGKGYVMQEGDIVHFLCNTTR